MRFITIPASILRKLALILPGFGLALSVSVASWAQSESEPDSIGSTPASFGVCENADATRKIASHIESRGGSASWLTRDETRALTDIFNSLRSGAALEADQAVAISPAYDIRLLTGLILADSWEIRFFKDSCLNRRWTVSQDVYDRVSEMVQSQDAEVEADPAYFDRAIVLLGKAIADEREPKRAADLRDDTVMEEPAPQEPSEFSAETTVPEPLKANEVELPVRIATGHSDYCVFGEWPEDIESADLTPENRRCAEENAAREERMRQGTESVEDWEIWGAQRRAREELPDYLGLPGKVHLSVLCELQLTFDRSEQSRTAFGRDIRHAVSNRTVAAMGADSIRLFEGSLGYYDSYAVARTAEKIIVFCTGHQFDFHSVSATSGHFAALQIADETSEDRISATVFALRTSQGCGTQCYYDGEYIVIAGDTIEELYIAPMTESAAGDYSYFPDGTCTRKFEFLRSKIEKAGDEFRVHGALRARVTCGKEKSGCLFEMPYTEVTLHQIDGIALYQDTRLRQFDPFYSEEYEAFADGAVWSKRWLNPGYSQEYEARNKGVALCAEAADRFGQRAYLEQVKEIGATALIVKFGQVPLE